MTMMASLTDSISSEMMDIKSNTSVSGYCEPVCGNIPAKSSWLDWRLSLFPFQMKTVEYYILGTESSFV